jgi:WD40 repeat protein
MFRPHQGSVTAMAFTPDGGALATVSHDKGIKLWEVSEFASRGLRWAVECPVEINHCQFSPDGAELFTAGFDGLLRAWSTADGKLLREMPPISAAARVASIFTFVLSREGDRVVWGGRSTGERSFVGLGTTRPLAFSQHVAAHFRDVIILAAYPGGFCSGSFDYSVKFWDWGTRRCHHTMKFRGVVRAIALTPDCERIAIAGVRTVSIYRRAGHGVAGKPVVLRGHKKCIECIEFSPNGAQLASASTDGTLRIWDAASGTCLRIFSLKLGGLHWVTYAPDGLTLAYSSLKGDIGLLDLDG